MTKAALERRRFKKGDLVTHLDDQLVYKVVKTQGMYTVIRMGEMQRSFMTANLNKQL